MYMLLLFVGSTAIPDMRPLTTPVPPGPPPPVSGAGPMGFHVDVLNGGVTFCGAGGVAWLNGPGPAHGGRTGGFNFGRRALSSPPYSPAFPFLTPAPPPPISTT